MEYVYAAMLLHKAGKELNAENLSKVLDAAGINTDETRVKALVASLTEVDIEEAIKSAPTMAAAPAATTAPAPEEAEPAEEEEEEEEEEAIEGLGALFG